MRKRLSIIIVIMGLLHVYIAYQLLHEFSHAIFIFASSLVFVSWIIIQLGTTARFFIKKQWLADIITWIGMLDMGFFSSLLILTLMRQIILFIYSFFYAVTVEIYQISAILGLIVALVVTLIGFINARKLPRVNEVEISIPNLPAALNGFRIAQISDIHVGPTIKYKYLKSIVDLVNTLNVELVAITGDLVDGSVEQLSRHTMALSDLKSQYGSFFVLGNHEYYSGANEWTNEIRRLGIDVLLNQHRVILHNGANLVIAGVTDFTGEHFGVEHTSNPEQAIHGAPDTAIKILLAHQPRSAILATQYGYSLQLSGHTHGGQFWPWNLFVRLQQPFTSGLHKVGDMWLYINRGTGYWGPPKRFGVPSEITLLKLVSK
jgi:predicted MPP superfamily phosphohydrolase